MSAAATARPRRPHSLCLFELPGVRLRNRSNGSRGVSREAMHVVKRERDGQRSQASAVARAYFGTAVRRAFADGVTIVVTRVAPSAGLDPHDGLPVAAKSVVDGIADALGLASDRDERVSWRYAAERGPWGVVVEVVERRACAACGQVVT